MKLVCINNDNKTCDLTIGKTYNSIYEDTWTNGYYKVINDNNTCSWYFCNKFITEKEYRKLKLEKLNENR
jgi:hypothetical protein